MMAWSRNWIIREGRDLELCGTIVETCVAVVPAPR